MVQIMQNQKHSNAPLGYIIIVNFRFESSPKMCALVLWTFCREIFSINLKAMNAYSGVDF